MRYQPQAPLYAALVAGFLGGCEKQPSQLEQTVQAQQTGLRVAPDSTLRGGRLVSPEPKVEQELDLSTPEKLWDVYQKMCKSGNWENTKAVWEEDNVERRETDEWMKGIVADLNNKYGNRWNLKVEETINKKSGRVRCIVSVYVGQEKASDGEGFEMRQKGTSYVLTGM